MGPIGHTVLSTSVGVAVWKVTDNPLAVPVAIGTGVFIDSDHVLDFLDWFVRGYKEHMLVLLHAWEYLFVLLAVLVFWEHPLYMAAVLGYTSHVVSDHLANRTYPLSYSIIYRIYRRFKTRWLVRGDDLMIPREETPLWGYVEPWLWRIVYRLRHKRNVLTQSGNETPEAIPNTPDAGSD